MAALSVDALRVFQDRLDGVPDAARRGAGRSTRGGRCGRRSSARPGALPVCSTLSSTTSLSQSRRSSRTFWTLPLSSPFVQSRPRDRLQYTASPSSAVLASASRFMNASIRTSFAADLLRDRRNETVRVPLHLVEPAHFFSVAAVSCATQVGADESLLGGKPVEHRQACPAGPARPSPATICHAIAWPSRISNVPRQASTLQKCRRTRACA